MYLLTTTGNSVESLLKSQALVAHEICKDKGS